MYHKIKISETLRIKKIGDFNYGHIIVKKIIRKRNRIDSKG